MSMESISHGRVSVVLLALAVFTLLACSFAPAQETAPRVEIFGGYSWVDPGGRVAFVPGGVPSGSNLAGSPTIKLPNIPKGWDASVTGNWNKWIGLTADFGGHYKTQANLGTFLFGPKLSFRSEHFSPFIEGLVGVARLSPQTVPSHTGFGAALGGGIDMYLSKHVGLRIIQGDYLFQSHPVRNVGGSGQFDGARLQAGLIVGLGGSKPLPPPTSSCSVQPTAVMAGEPVTATVSAQNFNPKHTLTYDWKSTGGKITGKETTASIDTNGLAPGNYQVTATVTDPKGAKNATSTTCNASFTINEPPKHPPTLNCTADPTSVRSGDPVNIKCEGASPDNRPLTYKCDTSGGGRITGTGPNFTLDTAGASAGTITVNCMVSDDRGLTANSSVPVTVTVPPPPPQTSKIGEIAFPNKQKPWRVDNTAKAILDDVALRLQRETDAKAVIVGYVDPKEKGGDKLAQQRAVNTKAYLTDEKGIDPGRIEVRTGTAGGTRAEIYLVPAGATFNVQGTNTFDESKVKKAVEPKKKPTGKKAPAKKGGKAAAPASK